MIRLKLQIIRSDDCIVINLFDLFEEIILCYKFYSIEDSMIEYAIERIVKICDYLLIKNIDILTIGNGNKNLYNKICCYLENSKLKINYLKQDNSKILKKERKADM